MLLRECEASPVSTSVILVMIMLSCELLIRYNKIAFYQLKSFDLFFVRKKGIFLNFYSSYYNIMYVKLLLKHVEKYVS